MMSSSTPQSLLALSGIITGIGIILKVSDARLGTYLSICLSLSLSLALPEAAATDQPSPPSPALNSEEKKILDGWLTQLQTQTSIKTPFSALVAKSAKLMLGTPYLNHIPKKRRKEELRIDLKNLECVSLVESALALGGCAASLTTQINRSTSQCFEDRIRSARYEDGVISGYASRKHYFTQWLNDGVKAKWLVDIGQEMHLAEQILPNSFMTQHPDKYPALADLDVFKKIRQTEKKLSTIPRYIFSQKELQKHQALFKTGDIVAIVGDIAGLPIRHVGFVWIGAQGKRRLLHASSHHGRVLVTPYSLAQYVKNRPDRKGAMIFRLRATPPLLSAAHRQDSFECLSRVQVQAKSGVINAPSQPKGKIKTATCLQPNKGTKRVLHQGDTSVKELHY